MKFSQKKQGTNFDCFLAFIVTVCWLFSVTNNRVVEKSVKFKFFLAEQLFSGECACSVYHRLSQSDS